MTSEGAVREHKTVELGAMSAATERAPLLEARGLTVRFGKVTALDGLELVAAPGQVLAILGPNGAGKTTFVRTVATLLRPASGELRVRGHDVRHDPVSVRRDIGLAGQFAAVEPTMTGRENLEMTARLFGHPRPAARRATASVIEMLGLGEVADRRSGGYSGGQRRRLDLGASLVGGPRLLLLDEPTTGLDPAGRREVWEAVRNLVSAGTDVLLTTHYLDEAQALADRVAIIKDGRILVEGAPRELGARNGTPPYRIAYRNGDGTIAERETDDPTSMLHELTGQALARGERLEGLTVTRPTLEDVYLELTAGDGDE